MLSDKVVDILLVGYTESSFSSRAQVFVLAQMSNARAPSGQQAERPQWRGDLSQATAPEFPYLARLQNASAQKAHAERLQEDRERAGLEPLPPCQWRVP